MLIEFSRYGRTHQCDVEAPLQQPPQTITIPFRPCVMKPPIRLQLQWLKTDERRGIELYRPVAELPRC